MNQIIERLNLLLKPPTHFFIIIHEFKRILIEIKQQNLQFKIEPVKIFYDDEELNMIVEQKNVEVKKQHFEMAAMLRDKEKKIANEKEKSLITESSTFTIVEKIILYKANMKNKNEKLLVMLITKNKKL